MRRARVVTVFALFWILGLAACQVQSSPPAVPIGPATDTTTGTTKGSPTGLIPAPTGPTDTTPVPTAPLGTASVPTEPGGPASIPPGPGAATTAPSAVNPPVAPDPTPTPPPPTNSVNRLNQPKKPGSVDAINQPGP